MSDDEFYETVPRQAFEVGDVPDEMDLSKPPTSGLEFLRRVKYEKLRIPEVVSVPMNDKTSKHQQACEIVCNGTQPAPRGFAPSVKWQAQQTSTFSRVRINLPKQKALFKGKNEVTLPKIKDQKAWFIFSLGFTPSAKDKDNPETKKRGITCEVGPDACPPYLTVVANLIQPDIEKLLTYHITWMNEFGFSHHQGRWIYALLAVLERPLTPDACSLLRGLVRVCAKLRSQITTKEHELLKPLNLIICLVANYFDQRDLRDYASCDDEEDDKGDS